MDFTIGCDPEFFLKKNNQHVSAIGLVGASPKALPAIAAGIYESAVLRHTASERFAALVESGIISALPPLLAEIVSAQRPGQLSSASVSSSEL